MYREIARDLIKWKTSKSRKPILLRGARQVGKTKLLKDLGKSEFRKTVYINFNEDSSAADMFEGELSAEKILFSLNLHAGAEIEPSETLIVLEEIQECPRALLALKILYENSPRYFIAASSCVMGREIYDDNSYISSFLEVRTVYPLSFLEFLYSAGEEQLADFLSDGEGAEIALYRNDYFECLSQYLLVGGMPEAAETFIKTRDMAKVRKVQKKLLSIFENDLLENAPGRLGPKSKKVWSSAALQLMKENKKFMYGDVSDGARGKSYENALEWLEECGMVYKVQRVEEAFLPLERQVKDNCFKLYYLDVGLLSTALDVNQKILMEKNRIFDWGERVLAEQFICQELIRKEDRGLYYWIAQRSIGRIDFLFEQKEENKIIALELQGSENLQAKSLKSFAEKYSSVQAVRLSLSPSRNDRSYRNRPIYEGCKL